MKYVMATLALFVWMSFTLILTISIVGMMIYSTDEWFEIPIKLLKAFEK